MKCKFCWYSTGSKSQMIDHIKNNHREKVTLRQPHYTSDVLTDSLAYSLIESDLRNYASESSFSGGGGSFDGGGSSSSYSSCDSSSSDSGSCGD